MYRAFVTISRFMQFKTLKHIINHSIKVVAIVDESVLSKKLFTSLFVLISKKSQKLTSQYLRGYRYQYWRSTSSRHNYFQYSSTSSAVGSEGMAPIRVTVSAAVRLAAVSRAVGSSSPMRQKAVQKAPMKESPAAVGSTASTRQLGA